MCVTSIAFVLRVGVLSTTALLSPNSNMLSRCCMVALYSECNPSTRYSTSGNRQYGYVTPQPEPPSWWEQLQEANYLSSQMHVNKDKKWVLNYCPAMTDARQTDNRLCTISFDPRLISSKGNITKMKIGISKLLSVRYRTHIWLM